MAFVLRRTVRNFEEVPALPGLPGSRLRERRSQQLVEEFRVALAAARLHALAHQKADDLLVAVTILLRLIGTVSQHLVHDRLQRAGIAHLTHTTLVDDLVGVVTGLGHGLKDLVSLVGADGIGRQQLGKGCHLSRCNTGLGQRDAHALKVGDHLVDQQVCDRLGLLTGHSGSSGLKEVGKLGVAGNLLGIGRLNAKVGLKTGALGIGQLGNLATAAVDELVVQIERRQIGIGEQTIVVGRLLDTHDYGALATGLPVAG